MALRTLNIQICYMQRGLYHRTLHPWHGRHLQRYPAMALQGPRQCIWSGPEEVKDLSGQDEARSRESLQG